MISVVYTYRVASLAEIKTLTRLTLVAVPLEVFNSTRVATDTIVNGDTLIAGLCRAPKCTLAGTWFPLTVIAVSRDSRVSRFPRVKEELARFQGE